MSAKRFSDFAKEEAPLDGAKIKIDDVINKDVCVLGYRITKSKYSSNSPRCLMLQVELGGCRYVIFTGSSVLIDQIEKYGSELPFLAIIRKIDRYYTFT